MKTSFRAVVSLACVLSLGLLGLVAVAQEKAEPPAKKSEWKPEDVVMTESAGQFEISPDGRWVVWSKSQTDKERDGRYSNLYLTSLTEKKETQLTRGNDTHGAPRWSPSGQLISFMSNRPRPKAKPEQSPMQLWLMSPFGGEPWHLTEFERGVRGYQWITDDVIVFAAEEDQTLYEREIRQKKDATRVVEDAVHTPPVRLFRLSVKDKKVSRLTNNDDWIQSWEASRDGKKAVAMHARSLAYQWDQKIPPVAMLHDLETGEAKELFADTKIRPFTFRWTKDNAGFYVFTRYSSHPVFLNATITLLYFYDVGSGALTQVNLDWENGLSFGFDVTSDGFAALLAGGARDQFARYTRSGNTWTRRPVTGEHAGNIFGFALGEDGKSLVYAYSTASQPHQWFRATLDGTQITGPAQITELNPQWKNKTMAKTEVVRWKGALDEEVEGILHYPHDYQPGKRYPLVLIIHGGPTGVDTDSFDDSWGAPHNLLNQRGAFVLQPNYHGSGNYGLKWAESICCGKYYELEIPDMEKGVDYLIERGLVDPERIGTMGWSNGSILSIQLLITNPDRYKAASVGAGDVEWISDWANVDFGQAFDSYYFGKSPLEDPELYIRKSPFFKMDRVKTPTIIYFGTEDRNVPTGQGWTHYRALYHLGKVPVRFLLFPGEPHGPRKLTHQLRKVEEEVRWFDQYLFKTLQPENEAFKKDSPLGLAFRLKSVQKVSGHYGVAFKPATRGRASAQEVLIPEVVKRGEIELGRFEVTRGQFAAFDRAYKFEPGTEDYPVNGVTLEQAQAYVAWLSKLTGATYRLPKADEAARWYESRTNENTLDHWAGYGINPDDAERLEAKVKELGGDAPLLRGVGNFPGKGGDDEELVFDLGGNVAEWVLNADGSGRTLGGSADRPADAKAQPKPADARYIGFRVVREPKK